MTPEQVQMGLTSVYLICAILLLVTCAIADWIDKLPTLDDDDDLMY